MKYKEMNPFILKAISELDRLLIKHCEVTIHELLRGLQLSFEDFYYLVETKAVEDGMNEARKCLLHWLNLTSVMSHELTHNRSMSQAEIENNAQKLGLILHD